MQILIVAIEQLLALLLVLVLHSVRLCPRYGKKAYCSASQHKESTSSLAVPKKPQG